MESIATTIATTIATNDYEVCSICLDMDGGMMKTICNHAFHVSCYTAYVSRGCTACPNCRSNLIDGTPIPARTPTMQIPAPIVTTTTTAPVITTTTISNIVRHVYDTSYDCLQYASGHGCPWDEEYEAVKMNGHLDCLKYAYENGCPWDENTSYTSSGGSLDFLKYAHENGCPWR